MSDKINRMSPATGRVLKENDDYINIAESIGDMSDPTATNSEDNASGIALRIRHLIGKFDRARCKTVSLISSTFKSAALSGCPFMPPPIPNFNSAYITLCYSIFIMLLNVPFVVNFYP